MLGAALAALVWVNVHASSYEELWETTLSIDLGGSGVSLSLREWVNSGLMTIVFFVLGLEARREFDLGELRERRRFALPLLAALGGMAVPVPIYLLFNLGSSSAWGWGIAMSTDTAFALGLLALVGPRFPDRLRAFLLTVVVVDDLVALVVIATVYTETLRLVPLAVAVGLFAAVLVVRSTSFRPGLACAVLGVGAGWRCSSLAWSRSCSVSRWACWPTPTRRRGRASNAPPSASASSASSRPPSSPASARVELRSATRRTSGCSIFFIPGGAT